MREGVKGRECGLSMNEHNELGLDLLILGHRLRVLTVTRFSRNAIKGHSVD